MFYHVKSFLCTVPLFTIMMIVVVATVEVGKSKVLKPGSSRNNVLRACMQSVRVSFV